MRNNVTNVEEQELPGTTDDQFEPLGQTKEDVDTKSNIAMPVVAYALFDGVLTGTNYPIREKGIAQVLYVSAGLYTVYFKSPRRDADYMVIASAQDQRVASYLTKTKESFQILSENSADGVATDATTVNVIIVDNKL